MTPQLLTVQDLTTDAFNPTALFNLVWGLNYQAVYHYNRSPWVEHGYAAPVGSVMLLPKGVAVPADSWHIELLDTSDQEGALGYHEDFGTKASSPHSTRGLSSTETPLAKVFCTTSLEAGVEPSEVASHELLEMMVDPYVVDEAKMRVYPGPGGKEYIAEVGDPVQGEGYDVGAPEMHPTGVIVANFAYPAWWKQEQTRAATAFRSDLTLWAPHTPMLGNLPPFQLAPEGYMSVRSPGGEWESIYGSAKAAAGKDPQ